jgi:phage-related minor tail protein
MPCVLKTKSGLGFVLQAASAIGAATTMTRTRKVANEDNVFDEKSPKPEVERDRARQLNTLIGLSERFGDSLSNAFAKNVSEGKKFDDVLKSVRQSLVETGLRLALAPLQMALSQSVKNMTVGAMGQSLPMDGGGLFGGLLKGAGSLFSSLFGGGAAAAPSPFAKGGVFSRGMVMPFAQGGVVGAPTYFPLGRGLGVMGEKGAEAVMPLARGPDGRLGIRAGGGGRPASVTVNISTPDAESFRRSEAQVSAALVRAVSRGQRGM